MCAALLPHACSLPRTTHPQVAEARQALDRLQAIIDGPPTEYPMLVEGEHAQVGNWHWISARLLTLRRICPDVKVRHVCGGDMDTPMQALLLADRTCPWSPPLPPSLQDILLQGLIAAEFLKLYGDACEARGMGLRELFISCAWPLDNPEFGKLLQQLLLVRAGEGVGGDKGAAGWLGMWGGELKMSAALRDRFSCPQRLKGLACYSALPAVLPAGAAQPGAAGQGARQALDALPHRWVPPTALHTHALSSQGWRVAVHHAPACPLQCSSMGCKFSHFPACTHSLQMPHGPRSAAATCSPPEPARSPARPTKVGPLSCRHAVTCVCVERVWQTACIRPSVGAMCGLLPLPGHHPSHDMSMARPCPTSPALPGSLSADIMAMEDDQAALHLARLLEAMPWHRLPAVALLRLTNILCYDIAQVGGWGCWEVGVWGRPC